jgi:hypothetical protein
MFFMRASIIHVAWSGVKKQIEGTARKSLSRKLEWSTSSHLHLHLRLKYSHQLDVFMVGFGARWICFPIKQKIAMLCYSYCN